jgi:hypothetical protein
MKKQLVGYIYALAIFIVAVLARLLIDFVVPRQLPYITFFPAVFLAGYYLGRGPGILVLLLSALAGVLWIDPFGHYSLIFDRASLKPSLSDLLGQLIRQNSKFVNLRRSDK